MRILWVEDQYEENRAFLKTAEARGASVDWAGSVAEAFRRLDSDNKYDVVVVDLRIPLGEGEEVEGLEDTDYNGKHIVLYLESLGYFSRGRVICLTNFVLTASSVLKGKRIRIVRKAGYLREFVEALSDEPPIVAT